MVQRYNMGQALKLCIIENLYITPIVGKKHVKTCSKAMADLYKQEDKKSWSNKSQNVIIIVTVWILKLITCIVEKIPVE
jgi:hypothetical protein